MSVISMTTRPVSTRPITRPRVDGEREDDDDAGVESATPLLSVVAVTGVVVVVCELWSVVTGDAM